MITGIITDNLDPRVVITVRGPSGRELTVNAVVDTGYTGFLTLPTRLATDLMLEEEDEVQNMLANGSVITVKTYRAVIVWDGRELDVPVEDGEEGGVLIGMELLEGYDLTMRVRAGGHVHIVLSPAEAA